MRCKVASSAALGPADTWTVGAGAAKTALEVEPVLGLSSMIMVRDAVRAGVGVARLPVSLVTRDLDAGRLVQWSEVAGPETELWLLYPSRRLLSARVAASWRSARRPFLPARPKSLLTT